MHSDMKTNLENSMLPEKSLNQSNYLSVNNDTLNKLKRKETVAQRQAAAKGKIINSPGMNSVIELMNKNVVYEDQGVNTTFDK